MRSRRRLTHLGSGAGTREAAGRMLLSEYTVQDHLKSVFAKTRTRSRKALLARALGTECGDRSAARALIMIRAAGMMRRLTIPGGAVQDADVAQFMLVRSRWRAAAPLATTLVLRAAVIAYAVALDVQRILVPLIVLLGVTGVASLVMLVAGLVAPPAVLTAAGPRLRDSAVAAGLTTVPWSDVRAAWFAYHGSQRILGVLAGARERAYLTPIPDGTVDAAAVAAAVHEFSGGQVAVADTPPPRPQTGTPMFRWGGYGRASRTALLVTILPWVVLLALLPWLTHSPQPWDQPWWPGNH